MHISAAGRSKTLPYVLRIKLRIIYLRLYHGSVSDLLRLLVTIKNFSDTQIYVKRYELSKWLAVVCFIMQIANN